MAVCNTTVQNFEFIYFHEKKLNLYIMLGLLIIGGAFMFRMRMCTEKNARQ